MTAKGLCDRHYSRLQRTGSVEGRTVIGRLNAKTRRDENGCWNWTGSTREGGYGGMRVGGKSRQVHRLGYEALVGPIPDGLQIDHLCRNKLCWNPDHLEPVTQRENILRSENMAARWARRTECHVCGGELTQYAKRRVCLACQRHRHHERKNA